MNAIQKLMMLGARVLPQPVMQRIGMLVMKFASVSKSDANPPTAANKQNSRRSGFDAIGVAGQNGTAGFDGYTDIDSAVYTRPLTHMDELLIDLED